MRFSIEFYETASGQSPVRDFLDDLKKSDLGDFTAILAGLKKLHWKGNMIGWRGKDEKDWSDLIIHAPPLYIQEKVHPKVLIDDLLRQTSESKAQESGHQLDLFADFNRFALADPGDYVSGRYLSVCSGAIKF